MSVTVYKDSDVFLGAATAFQARLGIPGWSMLPTLEYIANGPAYLQESYELAIKTVDHNHVAIALYLKNREEIWAFCKPDFRRRGYASECVRALDVPLTTKVNEGRIGSLDFWKSLGLTRRNFVSEV